MPNTCSDFLLTISIPAEDSPQALYTFTVGDGLNPLAPRKLNLVGGSGPPFVNTSVRFLNGLLTFVLLLMLGVGAAAYVFDSQVDAPGPLEKNGKTFFAVAPTPKDWSKERKESSFREYNNYMIRDLTVH